MRPQEQRTKFIVGNGAPSATGAYAGELVTNNYGNIALVGFMPDPMDPNSEVRLDTSVEPPVLHLTNALTTTLFGNTNTQTGEFIPFTHGSQRAEHIVCGEYTGLGSVLRLI